MIEDLRRIGMHVYFLDVSAKARPGTSPCPTVLLVAVLLIVPGIMAQPSAAQKDAALHNDVQRALQQGDYDRAIVIYRQLIRLEGNSAPLLLQLGVAEYQKGDYESAAESLHASLRMQPHLAVAEAFLGLSEAARGNSDRSMPLLEKTLASRDASVDQELKRIIGARLGQLYTDRGRLRDAEAIYMSLLKANPHDPQLLYQSFWLYMSMGRMAMDTLVREAPNSYRTHKLIGLLLLEKGNYTGAADRFRQALREDPAAPGLHYELGILALRANDKDGAAQEFTEELRLHPTHAQSYYQLAEQRDRDGKVDEAWELYGKALQFEPDFADAQVGKCRISLIRNQPNEALNYCSEAVSLAPADRPAHYLLARIYRALGQTDKANAELALFQKLQKQATEQLDFLTEAQIGVGSEH